MKRYIALLLALLFLSGCSKSTTVFLAEEEAREMSGQVVRIPVDSDVPEETAETVPSEEPTQLPTEEPTYPETNQVTVGRKNTASSQNTNTQTGTRKDTVSGDGNQKVTATEPPATEPPHYEIRDYQVGSLEYAMAARINEHRVEAGLPELAFDEWLCAIASQRSFELSSIWSHTRPDGRGFATVLDDYGYGAGSVTELLVYDSGSGDGTAMADRWMESDSHRESLLGSWHTVGIGVYRIDGLTYVTSLLVG